MRSHEKPTRSHQSRSHQAKQTLEFIKAAIRHPLEVSTVFPTSPSLAATLLDHADLATARCVVELGAGTGAITRHLEPRLKEPDSYIGIELDEKMKHFLEEEFPNLRFEQGLAQDLLSWSSPASIDAVVSSLPWSVFSDEIQERTITAIHQGLKPGGVFVTYVCVNALWYPSTRVFLERLRERFSTVEQSSLEWRNIPPAYVFRARK